MQKWWTCLIVILAMVNTTNSVRAQEVQGHVSASMMIAAPSKGSPQRAFGHAFLRMQYESEQDTLDYCFTQETVSEESAWDILTGSYSACMRAFPTADYIRQFAEQGRRVESLELNLNDAEVRRLWQQLDAMLQEDAAGRHDFLAHSCSQELTNILCSAVDGRIECSDEALAELGNSYYSVGTRLRQRSSWSIVLLHFLSGPLGYEARRALDLCFLPVALPAIFAHAELVDPDGERRPLLRKVIKLEFADDDLPVVLWFIVLLLLQLLLLATSRVGALSIPRQLVDTLLLIAYAAVSVLLIAVNVVTTIPAFQGWNWSFLYLNPLWAILWLTAKVRKGSSAQRINLVMVVGFLLFVVGMLLTPSHFCTEQVLCCVTLALAAGQRWVMFDQRCQLRDVNQKEGQLRQNKKRE